MESVISCAKVKEWKNQKGEMVPIYAIGLSDGRGGQSFGKEIPIGTNVADLEVTDKGQYGLDFKLKGSGSGFGGNRQRAGNESFALSYSKDLVVAGKVDIKEILSTADKLYTWLEGKKSGVSVAASVPQQAQKPKFTAPQPVNDNTDDLPF